MINGIRKAPAAFVKRPWLVAAFALTLAVSALLPFIVNVSAGAGAPPADANGFTRTYTVDADFDGGNLLNLNHDAPNNNQLQLNTATRPLPFIWIALSGRGTAVRLDVNTGQILGEYRTAPEGRPTNPSRTTVDLFGNVWVGNRDEASFSGGAPKGSVAKIGVVVGGTRGNKTAAGFAPDPNGEYLQGPFEYNTCVDRDGDGLIRTSRGSGHILRWSNAGGANTDGGVSTADDEAILIFQRISGQNARHVSVDKDNNVWVTGYTFGALQPFNKLDGNTGAILSTFQPPSGGYGGLIDGNGVLWSAAISHGTLLRYDTLTGAARAIGVAQSYGLGIDNNGFIWNAMWTNNTIAKVSPAGVVQPGFPKATGGSCSRGVAVTPDNHIWVANSCSNNVSRLDNSGKLLQLIPVGSHPTGVAVDANGKVWVTNFSSSDASRINPNGGGPASVDLTINLGSNATPYNYSDMTGSVVIGATSPQGTWTSVQDSGRAGTEWGTITWNTEPQGRQPEGTEIVVEARASDNPAGLSGQPFVAAVNGVPFSLVGRFLEVRATLKASAGGESPVLSDLTVAEAGVGRGADLSVTKTLATEPLAVDSDAAYKLTITNNGPEAATAVTLRDVLPAEISFVSCAATNDGACAGTGNDRTVSFASLTPNQTATVLLTGHVLPSVPHDAPVSNTATVSAETRDPRPENNTAAFVAPAKIIDRVPPTTAAVLSPPANAAGWHKGDVVVLLSAADNTGGRGVRDLTFDASGAQTLAPATVAGSTAFLTVSAEGVTSVSYFATDNAGNVEAVNTLRVHIDRTAPSVSCGQPEEAWHTSDVFVPCSGSDGLSGLVEGDDISFTLGTSVPAGAETSNAVTETREVCDRAGNCTTAGSVQSIRVDKTDGAATVRHPPVLNSGRIEGGVRQFLGESAAYAGNDTITDDLRVPGSPSVTTGENGSIGTLVEGGGSAEPAGYALSLNGNAAIGRLVTRTDSIGMPDVAPPPPPAGTRDVKLNAPGGRIGDPASLRDLSMSGRVGSVSVSPGTYGSFTVHGLNVLTLGQAGSTAPAVYNLQGLTLSGRAELRLAGPVVITVAGPVKISGQAVLGEAAHPGWLRVGVAAGGLSLAGGSTLDGVVNAPSGPVEIMGNSLLRGGLTADTLVISGGGVLRKADTTAPTLTIDRPVEGAIISDSRVTVVGRFSDLGPATVVTVNGVEAALDGSIYRADVPLHEGVNVLTVVATDAAGNSAAKTRTVVRAAAGGNRPPQVDAGPDQRIAQPNNTALLNGSFTDDGLPAGTAAVLWQKVSGPGAVTFADANSAATTAAFESPGTYLLRLSVSDSQLTSSDDVTVSNSPDAPVNQPPSANAGANQTILLPNTASLGGAAVDDGRPAGSVLTILWSKLSGPGAVTFGDAAAASTTAAFAEPGVYVLRFSASDTEFTSHDVVVVTVYPPNKPPVVNAGADQSIRLPDTAPLNGVVNDDGLPPGSALAITWSQAGGPGLVTFADANSAATVASFSEAGTYVLRLTASDTEFSVSDEITVIVKAANQPPAVNAGADQIIALPAAADLGGTVTDDGVPEGATVRISWTKVSGPGAVSFSNADRAATRAGFDAPGVYVLRLSATDSALSASDDVTVTVDPANQAPTANAGPDQLLVLPDDTAELAGTAADDGWPRGSSLSIQWSKVSGPSAVTFADASAASTVATFGATGTYVLRLTASDTALATSDEVTITLDPVNLAPVVSAGPDQTVTVAGNLLQNPGNDEPLASGEIRGWREAAGTTWTRATPGADGFPASFRGASYFYAGEDAAAELQQDVNVAAFTAGIAAGTQQFEFKAYARSRAESPADSGRVVVEFRDAANAAVLATLNSGALTSVNDWALVQDTRAAPAGTGWIRVRLLAARQSGATNDAYFDAVSLRALSAPAAALAGTAADDGWPRGSTFAVQWSKVSGPGAVSFFDATKASTSAVFGEPGTYVLRLAGGDSQLSSADEVTVTIEPANAPPTVNAGADQSLTLPDEATLAGTVADDGRPAGGTLTSRWSKVSGPGDVTFASAATTNTTASFSTAGTYVLRLTADDSDQVASDDITITVAPIPGNEPPTVNAGVDVIIEPPDTSTVLNGTVVDDGRPAGGTLTIQWSKLSGPGTVAFGNASQPITTAAFSTHGVYVLRLSASDSQLSASDDVIITVNGTNQAPVVSAGPDREITLPNGATLAGTATDDGLPIGSSLNVSWSKVSGPGDVAFASATAATTTASFSAAGTYVLRLSANDSQLASSDDVSVVVNPAQPAPTVQIASPPDGSQITTKTTFVGTVSGGSTWRLEYSPGGEDVGVGRVWTTVASGSAPVNGGPLGTFDPTLLLNGVYTVRLVATNAGGVSSFVSTTATVEGEQKVGSFSISFSDLNVSVAGLPIEVVRSYDSRDKRAGDFGVGWTLGVKNVRVEKSGVIGSNWEETRSSGFLPTYTLRAARPRVVTVTFPDNKVYKFRAVANPESQLVFPIEFPTVSFVPMPGTQGSLVAEDSTEVIVNGPIPGSVELLDIDTIEPYNPTAFRLTTEDGTIYHLDQFAGLRRMVDTNGNTLTVEANGITHSSGKSIAFARDAAGRITRVTDPAGNALEYTYDARGDLVAVKDRDGHTTTFAYNSSHGLLTINDPRGFQPLRNEYDEQGRLARQVDADGRVTTFAHDPDTRQEIVTDRLGRATVYAYDARGNVVRVTDAQGRVTTRTFDADDNMLSETTPDGKTRSFTYDARGNRLSESDALGNTHRYTYNSLGEVLTHTDAAGRVSSNTFDARGNLTSSRDALGNTTNITYNARGQQTSVTDPLGFVARYEYDAAGNLTRQIDPLGRATAYTYDANNRRLTESATRTVGGVVETLTTTFQYDKSGRQIKVTHPDGSMTETLYNSIGQKGATIDRLGRRTTYEYDEQGRLVRTTHPDARKTEIEYDAEGRRTRVVDNAGRATLYAYDSLGRLERTTYADGGFETTTYNDAGRVAATMDARGNTTRYEYDAAGRQTKVTDPLGNVTLLGHDGNGNRASLTDAKGQTTTFEHDASGRRTRTVHPDGTTETLAYDAAGRLAEKTDQAGRTTRYEYDGRGKLTKVTDALGGVTRYAYDEAGNLLAQADADNRTTRYEYDRAGRRARRTLPLGMSETYSYDAAGNLTSHVDFRGKRTTFTYDARNRWLTKQPDASLGEPAVAFTYTSAGQRASMADASGVTNYIYDARDRLLAKQTPQGALTYTYDAAGNLLTVRSSNAEGVSINYTYDAANRLAAVADNRLAAATAYTYDANHNVTGAAYPNGVTTSFAYDSRNNLTSIGAVKSGVVASYAYTLGPTGRRVSVAEHSGRTVAYSYDALHRLTGETISGDPAASGSITYSYDAVGNRLSRTSTVGVVPSTTSTYDENNRLVGDAYDANGNTVGSGGNAFIYDFENRLASANGGAVRYVYDGDGNRAAKIEGGVTTRYLVDTNNPTRHAQVVEELRGGAVVRQYTYGHDLISQRQLIGGAWAESFYGYDGHGSVRYLTDASGAVTDTYTYDAFGTLIARTGGTPNDYLYAGEQFDSGLGIYYLRARYLNPAVGRFLTMDTVEGELDDPLTRHLYAYVNGDPVNATDPSGHVIYFSIPSLNISITINVNLVTLSAAPAGAIVHRVSSQLSSFTIASYRVLSQGKSIAGTQIHHLIEQRLWRANAALQQIFPHVDDIPSVRLTPAQHQVFTNLWRAALPYSNQAGHVANPTIEQIMAAATRAYAGHPHLLRAILQELI
jgi:RHS repeat-associated protein/uncharacterized repeat protein (TIGR01451 family)